MLQVPRHIVEHHGLVLERADLVVDLLQRAHRLQQVLHIVGGIEDGHGRCRT